jgi:hypothetical protein
MRQTSVVGRAPLLLAALLALNCPPPQPSPPAVPWGSSACSIGDTATFYTTGTHPSGDSLSFHLDWGDGTRSNWTALAAPGDTVAFTRDWLTPGTYSVRAQARDPRGRESEWSDAFTFTVRDTTNHQPGTPALPSGPDTAWAYDRPEFRTVAVDPDGDQLMYRVAGAGDTGVWTGPVNSGDTFTGRLCPVDSGPQPARCQVMDTRGRVSDWSPACTIYVRPVLLPFWTTDAAGRGCPAVGDGTVIYTGDWDGIYAVIGHGIPRWQRAASCPGSIALGPDGTVLFCDDIEDPRYQGVRALRADGTDRWRFECRPATATPAVGADGSVYFGCRDSCFYALDSAGNVLWQDSLGDNDFGDPVLGPDRTIYVRLRDSLIALDSAGGIRWTIPAHSHPGFGIAIGADGTLYCGDSLAAIRPNGSVVWRRDTRSTAAPAIGPDGTIYQPSNDTLFAIGPDGTTKWAFASGYGTGVSTPAVAADGTLFITTLTAMETSLLRVLDPNGQEVRRGVFAGGPSPPGPAAPGNDGIIYVSGVGSLYAFRGTSRLANAPWPKYRRDLSNSGRAGP